MLNKKRIFLSIISIFIINIVIFTTIGVFEYKNYKNVANATIECPWQDGGWVLYSRLCLESYDPQTQTCKLCPYATTWWGPACTGYVEIGVASQATQLPAITAPLAFVYSGGGLFPETKMQFMACGAAPNLPWVIGIPGVALNNFHKTKNWFASKVSDFIIAGSKDN